MSRKKQQPVGHAAFVEARPVEVAPDIQSVTVVHAFCCASGETTRTYVPTPPEDVGHDITWAIAWAIAKLNQNCPDGYLHHLASNEEMP